jgi:AcrR family transcriptional regulator
MSNYTQVIIIQKLLLDCAYYILRQALVKPDESETEMTANPEAKLMDNPKVDRRIQRTRQALRAALLELIKEKGFDALSVEEITERANLGRATFYLHYKDKEDLLLEEFREIASNRVQVLSEIPVLIWKSNQGQIELVDNRVPLMPLQLIFEHASQNADLYRILLRGESSQRIIAQIREIIVQSINEIVRTRQQTESPPRPPRAAPKAVVPPAVPPEIPVELLAAYFSGALMSSLNWWLEQTNPMRPEEMARNFQHLFFPGVMQVMGDRPQPNVPD